MEKEHDTGMTREPEREETSLPIHLPPFDEESIDVSRVETIETRAVADEDEELPPVGRTNRTVFWSVMLLAALVLFGMLGAVENGAIALAAAAPLPVTVQAKVLQAKNFHLYPGISPADNSTPVAVNQLDGTITDLVISKSISLGPLGTVTVKLEAGQNTPVSVTGLTNDATGLQADEGQFQNLVLSTGPNPFDQTATSATLTNLTINSPYQAANSITLPGLTLSITHS
ncbi:MAG: hypothetical protein IRZ31_18145 [Thermogemmatispora sp.]|uniref:DUF6230 family protein n=1 Tax=Thermogemmatispora sp. TaxID=1968838 RepID=UPI0026351B29|nr:DUF6230 family protein [Thermogemmatispora sp.]MBX5458818.1 hypothetical protein [Thermogemmatispora sp.]